MIRCIGFDVEILPNFFSITFVSINDYLKVFADVTDGKPIPLVQKLTVAEIKERLDKVEKWQFYITDKDDSQLFPMVDFINKTAPRRGEDGSITRTDLYGFNSYSYDNYIRSATIGYSYSGGFTGVLKGDMKNSYAVANEIYAYGGIKNFIGSLAGFSTENTVSTTISDSNTRTDNLSKTITDMIPYRISVKGDPEHIESVTGAGPRQFPMKLNHMGDIAFKIDNSGVLFAHTPIISDTNQGFDGFFEYLTDFWLHIEPESIRGSKLEKEILRGVRNVDAYSAIPDEFKDELREKKEQLNAARNMARPQRPQRPQKPQVSSNISDDEPVKRPQRDVSNQDTRVIRRSPPKDIYLDEDEQTDILKDAHRDIRPNIKSDDLLK